MPAREGLKEYQETMDELEQPSGPAFPNCWDDDVPDFECCHAVNEFRIHGGGGEIGHLDRNELKYCALTEAGTDPNFPNIYKYTEHDNSYISGLTKIVRARTDDPIEWKGGKYRNMTAARCKGLCDMDTGGAWYAYITRPTGEDEDPSYATATPVAGCNSFYLNDANDCGLFAEQDPTMTREVGVAPLSNRANRTRGMR